jgi:uroporphyrin-III C-methyltransferase
MRARVTLIGAGPGDPELLTLKAVRALAAADVVLVDELVDRRCLEHLGPGAKVIDVGKRGGCRSTPQAFIQRLLARYARQGRKVARLKGGDPFVFGRGGEEAEYLRALGIEVEVIPGITSGIAVPAALGIPVTHRDATHGVSFVTGHGADVDWAALARSGTTLVIYMGLGRLSQIVRKLRQAGMPARTPACIIENGTLPEQRASIGTLASLSAAGFSGPALIVVGDVVRYARAARAASGEKAA